MRKLLYCIALDVCLHDGLYDKSVPRMCLFAFVCSVRAADVLSFNCLVSVVHTLLCVFVSVSCMRRT